MSKREYLPFVNDLPRAEGHQHDDFPLVIVDGHTWRGHVGSASGDSLTRHDEDSGIHLTVRRNYHDRSAGFYWELWKKLDEGNYLRARGEAPTVEAACQAALGARIQTRVAGNAAWHTVDHRTWKASIAGHEASVAQLECTIAPALPFQWERAHPAFDGVLGNSIAVPLLTGKAATLTDAFAACERAPTLAYLKMAAFVVEHPELGLVRLPSQEQAE
ncbi:hypothetical protein [Cupriavidus basilensis]|uniref:Uncharacterized protein n=1 Tax=Cupriavidus basilensis TaxID=68895 RepID=A0A0C4YP26_9BURK|nr:hypothetical protein [Cupriavidus basilensis]AJG22351.1 hypothetical protein RR42_s0760 [Cupriavidus basilensis]